MLCVLSPNTAALKKNKALAMVAPPRNFRATIVMLWERYRFLHRKMLLCWFVCPQRSFLVGVVGVKRFRRPWRLPDSMSGDGRECVFVRVGIKDPLLRVSHRTPPSFLHQLQTTECRISTAHIPNVRDGPWVFERTPLSSVSATSQSRGKHHFWVYKESQKNYLDKVK